MSAVSVRIDGDTFELLERLAADLQIPMGEVVAIAVRRMRQHLIGRQLSSPLTQDELAWLAADLA